jgi:RNA polymerase sigma factor for flagellar operon FliA
VAASVTHTEACAPAAASQVLREHEELIRRAARQLARYSPAFLGKEDLYQTGVTRLLEVAGRCVSHGARFEYYVALCVRGAMIDAVRRATGAPRSVKLRIARRYSAAGNRRRNVVAEDAEPHELLTGALQRAELARAIAELPRRQRTVLALCCDRGLTQKQTASLLGLSASRICHIRSEALKRLRTRLRHWTDHHRGLS